MQHACKWMKSPVGQLKLVASEAGLSAILWEKDGRSWKHLRSQQADPLDHPILLETENQLEEYFAGSRRNFTMNLDLQGTPFQRSVWQALLEIPYGEVRSYGDIARGIGKPTAFRAVGAAVGMNPISIVAPCHRVLGSTGALTGFAGGLQAKLGLLAVENIEHRLSKDRDLRAA